MSLLPRRRHMPTRLTRRTCKAGLTIATLICVQLISQAAPAQIVNVQPLVAVGDEQGAAAVLDAGLDARTGNTSLLLLSGSALLRYRADPHLVFILARAELGRQGGERFLNRDFEHARYRFAVTPRLELESFVQHDRDEFRRLALRMLWGAGLRFPLRPAEGLDVAVGAAHMLELERLSVADAADSGDSRLSQRLSSYLTLALKLDDRLSLGYSLYAQPRWDRPKDVRLLNEGELLVSLSQRFQLKLTASLAYDSEPPIGRRRLDTATKTSLQLRL